MDLNNKNTLKYLAFILSIIGFIYLFLYLTSCNKEPICGNCRTYIYEYNDANDLKILPITEKLYCGEYYKSELVIDTLENGWSRKTQKECY